MSGCIALETVVLTFEVLTSLDLDVSGCTALTGLGCYGIQLASLDVSGCTALTVLDCSGNQLTSLDLSGCTSLTDLDCSGNQLTSLDLSGCTALTNLPSSVFQGNPLASLDLSGCTALTNLQASVFQGHPLASLDLSGCTALTVLDCRYSQLTSLDLSGCTSLTDLNCRSNQLTSLDLSGCTSLTDLDCSGNQLTSLDLSGCTSLTDLNCRSNQLTSLDVSGLTNLTSLTCSGDSYYGSGVLKNLNVSGCTALTSLDCSYNQLTSLDLSGCTSLKYLDCSHNALTDLDVSACTSLTHLDCYNNQLITLDLSPCTALESSSVWDQYRDVAVNDSNRIRLPDLVRSNGGDMDRVTPFVNVRYKSTYTDSVIHFFHPEASFFYRYNTGKGSMNVCLHPSTFSDLAVVAIDEEHFPDFNFRRYVQENHDANQNGILETTESYCVDNVSQQVDEMGLVRYPSDYSEMFGGVLGLDVSGWGIADLSGIEYFSGLVALNCQDGVLESLDLRGCPDLRYIDCSGNRGLSRIELAHDSLLLDLDCNRTALDLKPLLPRWKNLEELDCRDMQLTELDLGGNPRLSFLNCSNNRIDSLSLVGSGMEELYCNENDIRTIEMGTDTLRSLRDLYCNFNRLAELDLSLLPNLEKIGFVHNGLACMDLSQNDWLESVYRNNTDEEAKDEDSTANYHAVILPDGGRKVALSSIPGLDASRMANLRGGTIQGDSLTFVKDTVSYFYHYRCPNPDAPLGGYFSLYLMETEPVRIDEATFPDEIFRTYVSEHLDSSANGYLESKEAGIKALDVSGLGIRDLRGIGYFSELESLDCSDNALTSLDLSGNPALQDLNAEGNRLDVTLDANHGFDLSTLPGFDAGKASDWTGGQVEGTYLRFVQDEVSYAYETGYQGSAELPEVRFLLFAADREEGIAIDEAHFPDEAFRTYVAENLDSSANGYLESKEAGIKALDVSGLGIQDLRGIEHFSELESLDCSANELTSLDLSGNPALQDLNAEGNRLEVTLGANNGFDLSTLPGFDVSKASDWEGGICRNNILTFRQREVTYAYATGYNGSTEDENLQSVRFSLRADREPGTANEIAESGQQGRVYAKDHVIHTEGIESEITVFTPSGILLYRGHDKEIPVRNDGVYIVRSGQQVWKVLVM